MSQFRDKKQIARRKNITRNIIILVIVLLLTITGVVAWSGNFLNLLGRPIWKAENVVVTGVQNLGYVSRTKASVYAENESLKKENASLHTSMIDYQILKSENEQLKDLMGRLPTNHTFVLGTILARPNRSPYDTIIIDVGADANIMEGQQIYADVSTPIGQISKVYAHDSLVMLYSNPGQTTDAVINGSNTSVELVGRGGGNFEMTVPIDLVADKGTMVVFPNTTESEIVAIVDGIISSPTDPIKKFILHSPVNIQSLKWVQVKKN